MDRATSMGVATALLALIAATALSVIGPHLLESQAATLVAGQQDVQARLGAERIGATLSGWTRRLNDPLLVDASGIDRAHDEASLRASLAALTQDADARTGVTLFVHDAHGHILATDPHLSDAMAEKFSSHLHVSLSGAWTSDAPGACGVCADEMDAVSIVRALPNGNFLAANLDGDLVGTQALHDLATAPGAGAWMLQDDLPLFGAGARPGEDRTTQITGAAAVAGTPWRVELHAPISALAPGVQPLARRLGLAGVLVIALMLAGVAIGAWADVRRRREVASALDALVQSKRLATLGLVSAGVTHEIKNVVSAAMMSVEMAGETEQVDHESLASAREALGRLAELAQGVGRFARPDHHEDFALIDVHDAIEDAIGIVQPHLRTGPRVRFDRGAACLAMADRTAVAQVLVNLLINASHAMQHHAGTISVTSRVEDGVVRVAVQDQGPGLAPEIIDRVFDPLFSTKAAGDGTGIGLWLSRRIARSHGGDLIATNPPDGGARFELTIPSAPGHVADVAVPRFSAPPQQGAGATM